MGGNRSVLQGQTRRCGRVATTRAGPKRDRPLPRARPVVRCPQRGSGDGGSHTGWRWWRPERRSSQKRAQHRLDDELAVQPPARQQLPSACLRLACLAAAGLGGGTAHQAARPALAANPRAARLSVFDRAGQTDLVGGLVAKGQAGAQRRTRSGAVHAACAGREGQAGDGPQPCGCQRWHQGRAAHQFCRHTFWWLGRRPAGA